MTDDRWIVVPNWDKFQHYGDRTPPWIKLYLELNHKDEWLDLTDSARGLLVRIWLLTGASRGVLNVRSVRKQGWGKHHASHLESLNHAGFIQFVASKPLAQRREEKKREEQQGAHAPKPKPKNPPVEAKMNAAAYRRHNPDEPFDYEAALAEITKRAGR